MYLPIMPQVVRGSGTCEAESVNVRNLTVSYSKLVIYFFVILERVSYFGRFNLVI